MDVSRFEHGFLKAFFDAEELGIGLIDTDLRYVRVNQALAAINGVSAAEHEGRTVRDVVPGFADLAESVLRQVIDSGRPVIAVEVEGPNPADERTQRHFRVSFFPIAEDQIVIGVAAFVLDVTARVQSQNDLKAQAREIYENVVQDLAVVVLAHEARDLDKAEAAAQRALHAAKHIASKVLLDEEFQG